MIKIHKENKGITLIALVVTIVVLLILAGTSIAMLTGDDGIITNAQNSKISTELSEYKEQLEMYISNKKLENMEFDKETLYASSTSLNYNTKKDDETGTIKTICPGINKTYVEKLKVKKGKLVIDTKNKEEIKIAQRLGIDVNPYDVTEDGELLSSDGNLLLMDETGTLKIPDSVTKVGVGAFSGLDGLKTIIIPSSVKEIGNNAFSYNTTLENVIIEDGVQEIGDCAFSHCYKLKEIEIPLTVNKIGGEVFYGCTSLKEIEIPGSVKELKGYSFAGCKDLEKVKLNDGLLKIGDSVFDNCTTLTTIKIPKTVEQIGNAFQGSDNLENIDLTGNKSYVYENGMLITQDKTNILFVSNKYLQGTDTLKIPEGVVNLNINISSNTNIKKLEIPKSLINIVSGDKLPKTIEKVIVAPENTKYVSENSILYEKDTKKLIMCYSKDANINIQDGIKSIGAYSFRQTTNVKNITLPDSVTDVFEFAFDNRDVQYEKIKIGKNVSNINPIFKYMNFYGTVEIDKDNNYYTVENNVLYSKDKKTLITVLKEINERFEIASFVENIGPRAFHNQHKMPEVIIPESVKNINDSFNFCSNLKSIDIPESVISLADGAFWECINLTEIRIHKTENSLTGAPWGVTKGMKVVKWMK